MLDIPDKNNNQNRGLYASQKYHGRHPKTIEKAILSERAREFAYEGKRWYDVLRFAKRNNYAGSNLQYLINLAINSAPPEKQQSLIAKYKDPAHNSHYWPIYYNEIETNKNLVQNPFYAQ